MGRKRKIVERNAVANEDKASNACWETISTREKFHLHADNSNAVGAVNAENNVQQNHNGLVLEKKSPVTNLVVRRSERLKNSASPAGSLWLKPVVEHVNLVENEKEEAPHSQQVNTLPASRENNLEREAPHFEQVNTLPALREKNLEREAPHSEQVNTLSVLEGKKLEREAPHSEQVNTLPALREKNLEREAPRSEQVNTLPVLEGENLEREQQAKQVSTQPEVNQRGLEEKLDYLVRAVDEFKSKVYGIPNDGPSPDISYKSLYIDSQKKIEALMEENYDLVRKLEFARGKIAAYETMREAMGAAKEVILVSALGRATEAAATLSPQAIQKCSPPPAAAIPDAVDEPKQKKNYQKKKAEKKAKH